MARRIIKGVLDNFLGTYTSRYSDYAGYWLFGMLVGDLGELAIDLLNSEKSANRATPLAAAKQLAGQKFREQMEKASLTLSCVREAHLVIKKLSDSRTGPVNGRICIGSTVRLVARVVVDSGRAYERETSIFVASHDPKVELRCTLRNSAEADPSTSSG